MSEHVTFAKEDHLRQDLTFAIFEMQVAVAEDLHHLVMIAGLTLIMVEEIAGLHGTMHRRPPSVAEAAMIGLPLVDVDAERSMTTEPRHIEGGVAHQEEAIVGNVLEMNALGTTIDSIVE